MITPKKLGHITIKVTASSPLAGDSVVKKLLVKVSLFIYFYILWSSRRNVTLCRYYHFTNNVKDLLQLHPASCSDSPLSVAHIKIHEPLCQFWSSKKTEFHLKNYKGISRSFWTESIMKSTTTTTAIINTHWGAMQMVMAARFTRLTHKIAIQPHLVADSCTICSSHSRRPVQKLLVTPSYINEPLLFVCPSPDYKWLIFMKLGVYIMSLDIIQTW
jgi:hypothetical protein